jgi:hypothetical protein
MQAVRAHVFFKHRYNCNDCMKNIATLEEFRKHGVMVCKPARDVYNLIVLGRRQPPEEDGHLVEQK